MKYEITQADRDIMKFDLATNKTLKFIRDLSFYKFSIGDVLIREEAWPSGDKSKVEWKVKMAHCNLPYKYVYVFENELGVGYIRRLSINGKSFVETPICVTEFDPNKVRFILDPEYADHMILSEENDEFDAKTRYSDQKKKREKINRQNKKKAINITNVEEGIAWINTLKVGDQFWYGWNLSSIDRAPFEIVEIHKDWYDSLNFYTQRTRPPRIIYRSTNPSRLGNFTLHADDLVRYVIFMQRPIFFDDIIG